MFARFDENPAMTLRVIKETKHYGRTHARRDNVKTVYPLQTKFAGCIINRPAQRHDKHKKEIGKKHFSYFLFEFVMPLWGSVYLCLVVT